MSLEGKITWRFLKNLSDALNSYKVRALIDAKREILDKGIYNEDQYENILFSLIKIEKNKFNLFNFLKESNQRNFDILSKFSNDFSIPIKEIFTYLELLSAENLISYDKKYIQNDDTSENDKLVHETEKLKIISIRITSEDPFKKKSIYEPVKVIFDAKICSGCGLCSGICPADCINIENGFGMINDDICIRCGLCYFVCPRSYLPIDLLNLSQSDSSQCKTTDTIGVYREIYGARTKVNEIKEICQDGGITSTCLYYLFKNNKINYALGAKTGGKPWCPEPYLMNDYNDVLKTAGTKYVNNPNLTLLNKDQLVKNGKIAVVGVPCMMQALLKSKIFDIGIPSLNNIQYRIGIFCMESFPYEEGFLKICEKLDVDVNDVKKTDINKGKFFIFTKNGEELAIPIKEISNLAREDCEVCFDLTSESADISIGSIGAPSGWNCVILRTEIGKKLYESLIKEDLIESKPIETIKPGLSLLRKVARSKRSKCNNHIKAKKVENKRIPSY